MAAGSPPSSNARVLPPLFRWLVITSTVVGLALRAYTHHWDPSLFLQLVFVAFGFGFSGNAVRDNRNDPVLRGIASAAVVVICVVIVTSGWLTVATIAPFVVMLISLGWAMLLRQFRSRLFVLPLMLVGGLSFWAVHALRAGRERDALLHVPPSELVRVEMRSPDGSRTEVLETAAQRAQISELLARAMPLYPNHEGIADAWHMRLVLRDGTTRDLLLGHGSRSHGSAWLEIDTVNEFQLPETLESVLARVVPDPARAACESTVHAVCAMAAQCNPTGRINLLVPREGADGIISFFDDRNECERSYLMRRCNPGGFACAPGETPQCVDLDAGRYGASRAVQVPVSCADVFLERR